MDIEKLYAKAQNWILTFGPRLIIAILLFIIGQWIIKLISKKLRKNMHRRQFDSSLQPFFASLVITVLQVLLILLLMQVMGIEMTLFAAVFGAFGVAAGFALSGTLQNFTSGILILLLKPYRVGENIISQGQEGTVSSIQIFYTVVTTFDNKTVIIPNSKLSNEVIINTSREGKRRLDIEMKFSYGTNILYLKDIVQKSLQSMTGILKDPEIRIGISALDADGFKLGINAWLPAHGFQDAKLVIQEKLVEDIKKTEIKLPGT